MDITLAYSWAPRQVREWHLTVPAGTSVRQALMQSGLLQEFTDLSMNDLAVGVWGRRAEVGQPLNDRDRIEIYRPLRVDPKVARRERFTRQGAKRAGLFANKRADAKAGYGG